MSSHLALIQQTRWGGCVASDGTSDGMIMEKMHTAVVSRRRASTYIMVMGTAMLVTAIGLGAIAVSRLQVRTASWGGDAGEAGILALSAAEHALAKLNLLTVAGDPTWRGGYTNGVKVSDIPFGRGTISWMLVDADGNLDDNDADPLDLYGIGVVGEARRVYRVSLEPADDPLDCLASAVHSGGNLVVWAYGDTLNLNGAPGTSNACIENWSVINGDVECALTEKGTGTYNGTVTEGAPARQMPDPNTVFDYYVKNGTLIDVVDLESCPSGHQCIQNNVLSPTSNPYGAATNRYGIYVIKCHAQNVKIQNVRVVGTIVLLEAGANCLIQGSSHWEPSVPNYPVLLVQGGVADLTVGPAPLAEAALSTNFNPPGTPYNGMEDADTSDTYPSKINGLVYVSGKLYPKEATIDGVIINGGLFETERAGGQTTTINYKATYLHNPPPGFRAGGRVVPVGGTWMRSALP